MCIRSQMYNKVCVCVCVNMYVSEWAFRDSFIKRKGRRDGLHPAAVSKRACAWLCTQLVWSQSREVEGWMERCWCMSGASDYTGTRTVKVGGCKWDYLWLALHSLNHLHMHTKYKQLLSNIWGIHGWDVQLFCPKSELARLFYLV